MARAAGISSIPNEFEELALLLSPWHALQPAATALARLMEGEMDRALTKIGLTAREFVTLLEIATVAFPSGETLAVRALVEGHQDPATGPPATRGQPATAGPPPSAGHLAVGGRSASADQAEGGAPTADTVTQREVGARLGLSRGGTSGLLARLEGRRLIERRAAHGGAHGGTHGGARGGRPGRERGRPKMVVTLTGAGSVLLTAAAGIARAVEEDWAMRLAREAAGSNVHYARANGLQRWLTESIAALRAQPASDSGRARRAHIPAGARCPGRHA